MRASKEAALLYALIKLKKTVVDKGGTTQIQNCEEFMMLRVREYASEAIVGIDI